MIGLSDIVSAIGERLSAEGYSVYDEDIKQTHLNGSAKIISLSVMPELERTEGGGTMSDRTLLFDLAFVKSYALTNAEFYAFIADMNRLLRPTIAFADREIMTTDINTRLVDGVGHYQFKLEFRDELEAARILLDEMDKLQTTFETE